MATEEEEFDLQAEDQDELYDDDQDDQPPGNGPYQTLHTDGPEVSAGSTGHPESCLPCTFYCFTRRGCNRGADCRFCHLLHQSKLQQRREAWKKQQREKRRSIRERVASETHSRRPERGGGGLAAGGKNPLSLDKDPSGSAQYLADARPLAGQSFKGGGGGFAAEADGPQQQHQQEQRRERAVVTCAIGVEQAATEQAWASFSYGEARTALTIGQDVELHPTLPPSLPPVVQYRVANSALPNGLHLDATTGVISGVPTTTQSKVVTVEAALLSSPAVIRATVEFEVVDFTRGGFCIGHVSEVTPGKFMLLLYVPDDNEDDHVSEQSGMSPMMFEGAGGQLNLQKNAVRSDQKAFHPMQNQNRHHSAVAAPQFH